jgi:lysozyme
MQTTDRGCLTLIRHEGVVPGPYLDVKDIWTFGIGHTTAAGPPDPARMQRGMPADLDAGIRVAFQLFRTDLAAYEADVLRAVKLPLEPHEFDALVSFHYNTGGIAKAALTRHLNAGNRVAAAAAFMGWLKPAAIRSRREAERDLFARGSYPTGTIPVWPVALNGRVDFSRPIRRLSETEALALLRPTGTPMPPPSRPASTPSWWQRLASLFTRKETT